MKDLRESTWENHQPSQNEKSEADKTDHNDILKGGILSALLCITNSI